MTQPDHYAALLREHLPVIDKLLAAIARRLGLRGDDADEFTSWAHERLLDDDYAILRKWRGDAQITTYFTVVLTHLGYEFLAKDGGRWRPSAAARREGRVAILLERLLYRDRMRLGEAAEWLRTSGETKMTDRELAALRDRLPTRTHSRRDNAGPPSDEVADERTADAPLLADEADTARRAAIRALYAALERLAPLERLVVRMFFLDGQSIADTARALCLDAKPLYRLKDTALRTLQGLLRESGLTREALRELLDGPLSEPSRPADAPDPDGGIENSAPLGPSNDSWKPNVSDDARTAVNASHPRSPNA
jgi:DNA-directed RNA polymerase specialized sigma24 family protein